jgi:hypothetical protein
MRTIVDSNQKIYVIQDIDLNIAVCNLKHVVDTAIALNNKINKVSYFWNGELKPCSKKLLKEMLLDNGEPLARINLIQQLV